MQIIVVPIDFRYINVKYQTFIKILSWNQEMKLSSKIFSLARKNKVQNELEKKETTKNVRN